MIVPIEFNDEQLGAVACAVVAELEKQGKVMVEPVRTKPFSVAEAAEEFGVSKDTVSRWGEAGMLVRVPGTARVLFTAMSVRAKQRGEV